MTSQRKPSEIIEDFIKLMEASHDEWKNSKAQVDQLKRLKGMLAKQKIAEEYVDTPPKEREMKGVRNN